MNATIVLVDLLDEYQRGGSRFKEVEGGEKGKRTDTATSALSSVARR